MHIARFNAEPAIFVAPGRVNLIGEHTDYAEGFVMPVAINFATLAAISPRTDGKIVIYSENFGEEKSFEAAALPTKAAKHWSDYPIGVVVILTGEGHKFPGFSMSLWGDVPLGSGLSSSAALEVVTALAVLSLIGASYPGPVLARLCQRVENEFVGANCGIMDQFISANGKENHALLLDCRDLSYRLAPIPRQRGAGHRQHHGQTLDCGWRLPHTAPRVGSCLRRDRQPPARSSVSARRHARGSGQMGP